MAACLCPTVASVQPGILYTNIPVITEVMYLLDFSTNAQKDFLSWVASALTIDRNTAYDFNKISVLMEKYADLPADFADASLVALCERLETNLVASVDSDFLIYTLNP